MSEISTSPSSSDDVLIRVENVSKRFCRDLKKSLMYGVQDIACDLLGRDRSESGLRQNEFLANQGVSFELRRGESLGLIGRNGAGKTTLLKMLNGLIKPDSGRIEIRGNVGALIALGAGFNPVLTGRENVYIAGSVLGMSKREIAEKYNDIVEFAEIADFMESPVQSYSSGMQVRLGFAIASSLNPDLLLVDEVLAVGDFRFRQKSILRMRQFLSAGGSLIFVSHNLNQVQSICQKCLYLKDGKPVAYGQTEDVMRSYLDDSDAEVADSNSDNHSTLNVRTSLVGNTSDACCVGEAGDFVVEVESQISVDAISLSIVVLSHDQSIRLFSLKTSEATPFKLVIGKNRFSCQINLMPLLPGTYAVRTNITRVADKFVLCNKGAEDNPDFIKVHAAQGNLLMEETLGEIISVPSNWSTVT